jgi:hypothetical protein
VPLGSQELDFEGGSFFLREAGVVALSAFSYALPRDRAGDRDGAGVGPSFDPES